MPVEELQSAICLALAVPHATLAIRCRSGRLLQVGGDRTCDLSILQLRSATLAALDPDLTDCSRWVESVQVGGSLRHVGHGLHERCGTDERWLATLIPPRAAAARLRASLSPELAFSIHPDRLLGAAAVRVRPARRSDPIEAIPAALLTAVAPPLLAAG